MNAGSGVFLCFWIIYNVVVQCIEPFFIIDSVLYNQQQRYFYVIYTFHKVRYLDSL